MTDTEAEGAARLDRLRALTREQHWSMLCFLDGYAPEAIDTALTEIARQAAALASIEAAKRDDLRDYQLPGHECSDACAELGG